MRWHLCGCLLMLPAVWVKCGLTTQSWWSSLRFFAMPAAARETMTPISKPIHHFGPDWNIWYRYPKTMYLTDFSSRATICVFEWNVSTAIGLIAWQVQAFTDLQPFSFSYSSNHSVTPPALWMQAWSTWKMLLTCMEASAFAIIFPPSFIQVFPLICHPSVLSPSGLTVINLVIPSRFILQNRNFNVLNTLWPSTCKKLLHFLALMSKC